MEAGPRIVPASPGSCVEPHLLEAAARAVEILRQAGYTAYFAGGFARDILLKRAVHDIDIATDATPNTVQALFPDHRAIGKSFGVIQIDIEKHAFEVATFRRDADYADGRHPGSVTFTSAPEDAQRRDFTVNGMFFDPAQDQVIDYVGGLSDLNARCIRAIGDPARRFREDYLRMMRAVRFAAVLGFDIDPQTFAAIRDLAPMLSRISPERIRIEMIRAFMEAPSPGRALDLLRDTGILHVIFPEVVRLIGVEQPPEFHPEGDVYTHTRIMLDCMTERSPALIWSILLHDIAKPDTYAIGTDRDGRPRIQFRGHAEAGAAMVEPIMKRFRCSNDEIEQVHVAVLNHMRFIAVPEMRESTLRRWVGAATFPLELELHRIDCASSHGKLDAYEQVLAFRKKLETEPVLPPPLIKGADLIQLGYRSGPALGAELRRIYDAQLEGAFTTRDEGLDWLRRHGEHSADIHHHP